MLQQRKKSLSDCSARDYGKGKNQLTFTSSIYCILSRGANVTSINQSKTPPLGTLTEYVSHPSQTINFEGVKIDSDGVILDPATRRLSVWDLQAAAAELLPNERITMCYRHRLPYSAAGGVKVFRRADKSTYYAGLKVCGSVWTCPVCARKISERRRVELAAALEKWRADGNSVLLMTLTVPHKRETAPFELLDSLLSAYRSFGMGRNAWTSSVTGYVGSVRALEVTHGANGWHPHLHVLVFISGLLDEEKQQVLESKLLAHWQHVTALKGVKGANSHALKLDSGEKAAAYVGKWGLAEEVTKAHVKQARGAGGRTPWALLADYLHGDKQAGALFAEFARVFKGRSQLSWSRGLREALGLFVEKTDQDLAEEKEEANDELAAEISPFCWAKIKKNELRGVVLEILRDGCWDDVLQILGYYDHEKRKKKKLIKEEALL